MKLRTKAILFLGSALFITVITVIFYTQHIVGTIFKEQAVSSFRSIAEQTENAYLAYVENMKTRTIDWASDSTLRNIAKAIIDAPHGSTQRANLSKEFAAYVIEKKMPFDKTIFLVDLLDRDGMVVASTDLKRIGIDEGIQEFTYKAHAFSETIISKFGEAFTKSVVVEAYENPFPVLRATVRLAAPDENGIFQSFDAVLLVHFANAEQISNAISGMGILNNEERLSAAAFLKDSETSDIYLVNSEHILVTPSRLVKDVGIKQKIDTLPVTECFDRGLEINEEYDNYQGLRVLGASMCFERSGLVLVVETSTDEVFAPVASIIQQIIIGGAIFLVISFFSILLFIRRPIKDIDDIVVVAKRVTEGDLDARVPVKTNDEIGYLAAMFNDMIKSVYTARTELELSKDEIEKKAVVLERDVASHEKQEKELEELKKAILNLLEDSWRVGEKLKVESSRLQTILRSIGEGLVLIDNEYKITLVNPQIAKIFSISEEDLMGSDLREIMRLWKKDTEVPVEQWPTEEMFLTKSVVITTTEDEFSLSTAHRDTRLPVSFSVAPLAGGLSGGVIVIHDTTADHELSEAKSGFISVASHQLRTPLTSIRWYSEMLLSGDVGPLNDAQRDFMTEVHSGAERLYQTVDLLLGISRVESGKIKSEKQQIDLSMFTGDITKELASQIAEKGSTLSVVTPQGDSVVVSLDPITLRQVILNIISNAIRYTSAQNGIIEVEWKKNETGDEVIYSVRDNGIGIPVAVRDRIFSKFFRAENARAAVPDGSGLGLALVKELVVSWGGRVWFSTEEGKGTTFFFTIPIKN